MKKSFGGNKSIIVVSAAAGVLSVAVIVGLSGSSFASAILGVGQTRTSDRVHHVDLSVSDFLNHGGRSVIEITPNASVIDIARGSTGQITLTVNHISGANPVARVTVVNSGIANNFIPYYNANLTTDQERAHLLAEAKPIPGAIDLNALVSFTPKQLILKPGESGQVQMNITIPKDWSDKLVGQTIFFSLSQRTTENYHYPDVMLAPTGISVHITG